MTALPLTTVGSYTAGGVFVSNTLGTGNGVVPRLTYTLIADADTAAPTAPTGLAAAPFG